MNDEKYRQWVDVAWALEEPKEALPVPFNTLLGEALDVLRFAQRHWNPARTESGQQIKIGLSSAVKGGTFSENEPDELRELYEATQAANTNYRLAISKRAAPVERAQYVLGELKATLEWLFEDGQQTDEDAQLDSLGQVHANVYSHDAIATALFDYAELASRHEAKMAGLGGFDVALISEARDLTERLRAQSAGPAQPETPAEREALQLRNRLATLLYERMQRLRTAARFVFRAHPELVREVGSAYGRRQRAAHRRRKAQDGGAQEGGSAREDNTLESARAPGVAQASAQSGEVPAVGGTDDTVEVGSASGE